MKFTYLLRMGYGLGALACFSLLAFGLYLQYYEYQDPCPLCILQRLAFIAMMIAFLVAAAHGPTLKGAYVYGALLIGIALFGGGVAARQVWLQHLPEDRIPACGPGLNYMLNKFPLAQALEKILKGSGECADVSWRFLSLSIAEWSLLWFVLLSALTVVVTLSIRRRTTGDQAGMPGLN